MVHNKSHTPNTSSWYTSFRGVGSVLLQLPVRFAYLFIVLSLFGLRATYLSLPEHVLALRYFPVY